MKPDLTPDYYLHNFRFLLDWVAERYVDLLNEDELAFIAQFRGLSHGAQCLLVRLAGRTGTLFRANKLRYAEIASLRAAADELIAQQLLQKDEQHALAEVAAVLTKGELLQLFAEELRGFKSERKDVLIALLDETYEQARSWREWTQDQLGELYTLRIQAFIDYFLLLFFGNAHQNLTEFVLQDLGLFRYENYTIDPHHRVFKSRDEIAYYRDLVALREQWQMAVELYELVELAEQLPASHSNPSLERRRAKLCNQMAYAFEQHQQPDIALLLYQQTDLPPSRERRIRLLEKRSDYQTAWQLLNELFTAPANEHELQIAERMAPRLAKKAGVSFARKSALAVQEIHLQLAQLYDAAGLALSVEEIARQHFDAEDEPCFYVENHLLNSLFGLWLWPEMFRGIDGAFSNPFQSAPLDLYEADFQARRSEIKNLWQLFDDQQHPDHLRRFWQEKHGITNHFVSWTVLDEALLELALQCIPAAHLKAIFTRLLFDLKANRSGLPDLIQFYPASNRYRMIEVKGPGDRVQDNQQRWLQFFRENNIPAEVCYVSWR